MFCGNGSGMATLLQQKNCMKTLSNGGVSGGGNNTINNSTTATLQSSRVLVPHEMVNLPSSVVVSTGSSVVSAGNVGTPQSVGAFVVTQQQPQMIIQQSMPSNSSVNDHSSNNNSHNNQFSNQIHQFSSRYFPQNNYQESNIVYVPATTTTTTSSSSSSSLTNIKNIPRTSSHILITNSNVVTTASSLASPPLTVESLAQHNQILQFGSNGAGSGTTQTTIVTSSSANNLPSVNRSTTTTPSSQHANSSTNQSHHPINKSVEIVVDRNATASCGGGGGGSDGVGITSNPSPIDPDVKKEDSYLANGIQSDDTIAAAAAAAAAATDQESDPEIDIVINNVVCSFSVRCHLNLRDIALNGFNVEFRRENGMVTMKLRRPYTTASIWSSGRITCTGATSEDQAKIAARRYARCLQKLGFRVRFHNFRVVNVLGTCSMPWAIKIVNFSEKYKKEASYEPELHPGVTYRLKYPKATLKIFSTGSITVTAGSVAYVQAAIEHIFPLVYEFRKKRTPEDMELLLSKQQAAAAAAAAAVATATNNDDAKPNIIDDDDGDDDLHSPLPKRRKPFGMAENDPTEDIMYVSDVEDAEAAEDL